MALGSRVYFISDAHLGTPDDQTSLIREKHLVSFLDRIKQDAAAIYLLGDIFDFWYEYAAVVPRGFTRLLGKISELTDAGVPIHYFTGNHDLWTFGYLEKETGVSIHRHPLITEILGKTFYLAHGDGFDTRDRKFSIIKKIFTNPFLQWSFSRLHPNFAFLIAKKWSRQSRDNHPVDPFREEDEPFVRYARKHLMSENLDYLVFGHRHYPVQYPLNEATNLIILGDWLSDNHYGVFDGKQFDLFLFDPHTIERPVDKE